MKPFFWSHDKAVVDFCSPKLKKKLDMVTKPT